MARKILLSNVLVSSCKVMIADEPTPGLDKESLNEVLRDFRDIADNGCAILMITHDIEAAMKIADKIAVFYAGTILEVANVEDFRENEAKLRHPYSKALYNALPQNKFQPIKGSQPLPSDKINGCVFYDRCEKKNNECSIKMPDMRDLRNGKVRCIHAT